MKLFEAKRAAEREFYTLLSELNVTEYAFKRAFSASEPFIKLKGKFAGTAARALYGNQTKLQPYLDLIPEAT